MMLLHYLGYGLAFILLTISYFAVIKILLQLPSLIFGAIRAIIDNIREKEIQPIGYSKMARFDALGTILFALVLIVLIFVTSLPQQPLFLFWKSPLLIAIFFLISMQFSGYLKSYNPIFRPIAMYSIISGWPVFLVVLVAPLFTDLFTVANTKWAAILSLVIIITAVFASLSRIPREIQMFEELDKRHDDIGRQLRRLQHIGNVLRDSAEWNTIQEAIHNVETSYKGALNALREKNFKEAESKILGAEAEVDGITHFSNDRIRLSLKDELKARLHQATQDCEILRTEFEQAGFEADNLVDLENRVKDLSKSLEDIVFEADHLTDQIKPFETLFADVVTTRTALRFRNNVGASLDTILQELKDNLPKVQVSEALGLDTVAADAARSRLIKLIESFRMKTISSAELLIQQYRELREAAAEHRSCINALVTETNRSFLIHEVGETNILVFAPGTLTTKEVSTGAILIRRKDSETSESIDCELDGVLVELQESRSFSIELQEGESFAISPFHLAGKRGGKAKLTVRIFSSGNAEKISSSFLIPVRTPASETARDAFIFATPTSGLAVWLLWYFWRNISIAAPLGIAAGGAIGLVIFLLWRIRAIR